MHQSSRQTSTMDPSHSRHQDLNMGQCGYPAGKQPDQPEIEKVHERERTIELGSRGKIINLEITTGKRLQPFSKDPWLGRWEELDKDRRQWKPQQLQHRSHHKVLVLGAGYGGLLFAIRLIETGAFIADDIIIVDRAAGFGGTWYWNRYPGLMCDVESYIYMPLLQETGYMPRRKYASGTELREYAELLSQRWNLTDRALFRTEIQRLDWDDSNRMWILQGQKLGLNDDDHQYHIRISGDFAIVASGIFSGPKIPDIPHMVDYQGDIFHTARWDYDYTGGSQGNPELTLLRDKRVGIIGTGSTAVQVIPPLAEYSKELLVFQRTAASVAPRQNRPTDPDWWHKMTRDGGRQWQRTRMENFNEFTSAEQPLPLVNMVADEWTKMPSFSVIVGSKQSREPDYLDRMNEADVPRQSQIRERVRQTVHRPTVMHSLMPWYSGWCKRPCFHDEYLQAFNRPNVRLIDIRQHGISRFTRNGIVANGVEREVDVIILCTGYISKWASPGARANIAITGRNGVTMDQKWTNGLSTLHGVMTRDFPNLFFPGPNQAGICGNQMYVLDQLSTHIAHIMSTAVRQRDMESKESLRIIVEPTKEAEDNWATEVISRVPTHSALTQCSPEGKADAVKLSREQKINVARMATWGEGIQSYISRIEEWRGKGGLQGVCVCFE